MSKSKKTEKEIQEFRENHKRLVLIAQSKMKLPNTIEPVLRQQERNSKDYE